MADDGVKYETRTVWTIRGGESRTAAKWAKAGWEVVSQSPRMLQTEITIRRPKPKTPWRLAVFGGGALVVLVVGLIVHGTVREQSASQPAETPAASAGETSTSSVQPLQEPAPTASAAAGDLVLTPESNADLAAILDLGDYCDGSIAAFAEKYRGQTIAFDGSVAAMNSHDGASTRYDMLIGPGDYSEASVSGPAFLFRDVNTTYDLHYTGDTPGTIGVGTNLHVTAQVDEYEPKSCLFLLDPVETALRSTR